MRGRFRPSFKPAINMRTRSITRKVFDDARNFYKTEKWAELREACLRLANYTCKKCGSYKGKRNKRWLEAHHKISRSRGGADALHNLVCLCKGCHEDQHPHLQARRR